MTARIIILAAAAALAACHAERGKDCTLDSDCKEGLFCWLYTGTCEVPCHETADCDEGLVCLCEPDRECPELDEDTPLDDVQGGACLAPPAADAATDDAVADTAADPDAAPDTPADTVPADTAVEPPEDVVEMECGPDGSPDVLPDGACVIPETFTSPTLRVEVFQIGTDGHPGSGLDLDGNPATCSPQPDPAVPDAECSGGVENAFWAVGLLANDYLSTDIDEGELNLLMELPGFDENGCPFTMNYFRATRVPPEPPACPEEVDVCSYAIFPDSFDEQCRAMSMIGGVRVSGTHMSAGPTPRPYLFTLVVVGLDLVIPMHEARFEGTFTPGTDGPDTVSGIIGGYIVRDEFIGVLQDIPADEYPFPGKDNVIQLIVDMYDTYGQIENDADLDDDTVMDAASVGVIIDSVPATIVGIGS